MRVALMRSWCELLEGTPLARERKRKRKKRAGNNPPYILSAHHHHLNHQAKVLPICSEGKSLASSRVRSRGIGLPGEANLRTTMLSLSGRH